MAEALAELEVHNISTAPKFGISLSSLQEAANSEEACTQLYEQMKEAVGEAYLCRHLARLKLHHWNLYKVGPCQRPFHQSSSLSLDSFASVRDGC